MRAGALENPAWVRATQATIDLGFDGGVQIDLLAFVLAAQPATVTGVWTRPQCAAGVCRIGIVCGLRGELEGRQLVQRAPILTQLLGAPVPLRVVVDRGCLVHGRNVRSGTTASRW